MGRGRGSFLGRIGERIRAEQTALAQRLHNPLHQYANPQAWNEERQRAGTEPGQPGWYGQNGPPGGQQRVGYQPQGPLNQASLGSQGPMVWDQQTPFSQGALQWPGITQSAPRPNSQPVGPGVQIAQADALRARQ